MTTDDPYGVYRDRLASVGRPVRDRPIPTGEPVAPEYFVLYLTPVPVGSMMLGVAVDVAHTLRTVAVAPTVQGVMRLAGSASAVFTDWTPAPGLTDPLTQIETGPILPDTQGAATRYSVTVVHRTIATRQGVTP